MVTHSKDKLNYVKKLAYLRDVLKDGLVRHVIGGVAQDAEFYKEAIACCQRLYNRPHLIHQELVCTIYEAPSLKDGNGRELHHLYDVATPHLHVRALKAMDYEPSGSFVTSFLELKLDPTTMFELQRHSQGSREVPHYTVLLEFLDLPAHASKNTMCDTNRGRQIARPEKKLTLKLSYHVNIANICVA